MAVGTGTVEPDLGHIDQSYGAVLSGDTPLLLYPSISFGPPVGFHFTGELYVDANGVLYFCTTAGNPGTWKTVVLA
jgi:hypothetical protein